MRVGRLLITGVSGLLGTHLQAVAKEKGWEILGLCRNLAPGDPGNWISVDVAEPEAFAKAVDSFRPELVVHAAAWTDVDGCETNQAEARRLHVGAARVISGGLQRWRYRCIIVSTDAVFSSDQPRQCFGEDETPNPCNFYAQTKYEAEEIFLQGAPDSLVVRTNLFGWNIRRPKKSLVEWALSVLNSGKIVPGFCDVWFNPLYVGTLSRMLLDLGQVKQIGRIHLGTSDFCTKYEFLRLVALAWGYPEDLVAACTTLKVANRAPRSAFSCLSIDRARSLLGWQFPVIKEEVAKMRADWLAKLKLFGE